MPGANTVANEERDLGRAADDYRRRGRLYAGVRWRGTGYKFAPWVGRVLAQLALQRGAVYDIRRFTPARFAAHEEKVA